MFVTAELHAAIALFSKIKGLDLLVVLRSDCNHFDTLYRGPGTKYKSVGRCVRGTMSAHQGNMPPAHIMH